MSEDEWWKEPNKKREQKAEDKEKKQFVKEVTTELSVVYDGGRLPLSTRSRVMQHAIRNYADHEVTRGEKIYQRREDKQDLDAAKKLPLDMQLYPERHRVPSVINPDLKERLEVKQLRGGKLPEQYKPPAPVFDWNKIADAAREQFPDIKPTPDRSTDREQDR